MTTNPTPYVHALNLGERAALLAGLGNVENASTSSEARRGLTRWAEQSPFDRGDWLDRRLANDGLDRCALLALLDGNGLRRLDHALHASEVEQLGWWRVLRALMKLLSSAPADTPFGDSTLDWGNGAAAAFLDAFEPLIQPVVEKLETRACILLREHPKAPIVPARLASLMTPSLGSRLATVVGRTLVTEMHAALREPSGVTNEGVSGEERFATFVRSMARPRALITLFGRYPVLARLFASELDAWSEFAGELVERLIIDWAAIVRRFAPDHDPGVLTDIVLDAGDRHYRGRSVCLLTFASGWRLVYKPRPLGVDHQFAVLLAWLAQQGAPRLACPAVLDRSNYGWQQHVAAESCRSAAQAQRYFERFGALVAVGHMLAATDCHAGNVIAAGENPMLVDLETLLHPRFANRNLDPEASREESALANSILRVGLLANIDRGARTVVARGALDAGAAVDPTIAVWQDGGTDRMRVVRRVVPRTGQTHQARLNGELLDPRDYREALRTGFTRTYECLRRHRSTLLAPGGAVATFAETRIRIVLRPTRFYQKVLTETFHPRVLQDALERDRLFDRLWFGIDDHPFADEMVRLYPAEQSDLWVGDIPYFSARADGRELRTTSGDSIPGLLEESGMDAVRARFASASRDDLERQLWFLDASLSTVALPDDTRWPQPPKVTAPSQGVRPEALVDAACRIGDRLIALAHEDRVDLSWWTVRHQTNGRLCIRPIGADLYGGRAGIALFFAHLHAVSGHARYAEAARRVLAPTLSPEAALPKVVGAFNGVAGLVYVWTQLGLMWQDKTLAAAARRGIEVIEAQVVDDDRHDIVSGAAGAAVVVAACHRMTGDHRLLGLLRRLGRHLVESATVLDVGVGWPAVSQPALGGMAHGASGIAWALAEISSHTDDTEVIDCARRALAFEATLFDAENGNWRDRRIRSEGGSLPSDDRAIASTAWCHGAPGIGQTRLRLESLLGSDHTAEIDAAIAITRRAGWRRSHCLCHGALGNLDFLAEVARHRRDHVLRAEVEIEAARILETGIRHGWISGVASGVEVPGLMTGLAGIGHGLLRHAAPERVPSVLILEPLQASALRTDGVFPPAALSGNGPSRRNP